MKDSWISFRIWGINLQQSVEWTLGLSVTADVASFFSYKESFRFSRFVAFCWRPEVCFRVRLPTCRCPWKRHFYLISKVHWIDWVLTNVVSDLQFIVNCRSEKLWTSSLGAVYPVIAAPSWTPWDRSSESYMTAEFHINLDVSSFHTSILFQAARER